MLRNCCRRENLSLIHIYVVVEKPIQLVNILRADVNFMVNRRVLIILEDGAQARLLICDQLDRFFYHYILRHIKYNAVLRKSCIESSHQMCIRDSVGSE